MTICFLIFITSFLPVHPQRPEKAGQESNIVRQPVRLILMGGGLLLIVVLAYRIHLEKKRSDKLLLNILPSGVAEELKRQGKCEAKLFDHVTVLFTDFKDFTRQAEKMTPQELVHELDTCFRGFDAIICKCHLEKIKTAGDSYLAVSGLPIPNPQHAEAVVKAAMEIRSFMRSRLLEKKEKTFQLRLGIHSGSVVAGIVGEKKYAYDIWGDTVNTAARMEQSSAAGMINISETTYDLIKAHFACAYRGKIQVKHKGKVKMYFVC